MRRLLIVPFGVLSMLLIAATCMTNVERKGPSGPWIGEVTNVGEQTIHSVLASGRIYDADGYDLYANVGVFACPSRLLPGERGAFELFATSLDYPPSFKPGTPTPPLRAEFFPPEPGLVGTGPARGDGLLVRELERLPDERSVRIELTNDSEHLYQQFTVCGVLRDRDGKLLEVGRADGPPLPFALFPGDSIELNILFNSLPEGHLRFHALGLWNGPYTDCCPVNGPSTWISVKNQSFSVLLPPGWTYEPLQGIDSFVGRYYGDGAELVFDYGRYSDLESLGGKPPYDGHQETIGGMTALIVVDDGEEHITGADFAEVPSGDSSPPLGLTIAGMNLTPEQREIALQIFRSVRFAP